MTDALPAAAERPKNRKERRHAARLARCGGHRNAAVPRDTPLRQAARLHQAGDFAKAAGLYRQILSDRDDHPEAPHLLGALLASQGRADEAIGHLIRAAALTPENPNVHYNLAVAYDLKRRDRDAEQAYEAAIALRPAYVEAFKGLAALRKRRNDLPGALAVMRRLLQAAPENPLAHHMAALLLQALGRADEALPHFRDFARLTPESAEARSLLGQAYAEQGSYDDAVIAFSKCLSLDPDRNEVRGRLALLLADVGARDAALDLALEALERDADLPVAHAAFAKVVRRWIPETYSAGIERALCLAYDRDHCKHQDLARAAVNTIRSKYSEMARRGEAESGLSRPGVMRLDGIMGDALLLKLLDRSKVSDPAFEVFLTSLREAVLRAAPLESRLPVPARRFIATLARHCHENSHVFFQSEGEHAIVQELKQDLAFLAKDLSGSLAALEDKLVLVALYEPLIALPEAAALGAPPIERWSEECRVLIRAALLNPLEERRIRPDIEPLTEIEDTVSKQVQAQYESNPYPRWWHSPHGNPIAFSDYLRVALPAFDQPDFLKEPLEVLVAGCGTGQHPISVARLTKDCRVLAVDLSRASLAYAIRMAREIGIESVTFRHGDILSLSCLDRRFPVIECAGVLHHMQDPEAGLAVLADLLRPGGVMKLGLYSEVARASVVAARARIAALGLSSDAADIRAFRHRILSKQESDETLQSLLGFGDFFDLDSARDLMFHVQEHRFTIPRLAALLDRHGLAFLGFQFAATETPRTYAARFPEDPAMTDLRCWQRFEEEDPSLFRGMYQFWCQKPL